MYACLNDQKVVVYWTCNTLHVHHIVSDFFIYLHGWIFNKFSKVAWTRVVILLCSSTFTLNCLFISLFELNMKLIWSIIILTVIHAKKISTWKCNSGNFVYSNSGVHSCYTFRVIALRILKSSKLTLLYQFNLSYTVFDKDIV